LFGGSLGIKQQKESILLLVLRSSLKVFSISSDSRIDLGLRSIPRWCPGSRCRSQKTRIISQYFDAKALYERYFHAKHV